MLKFLLLSFSFLTFIAPLHASESSADDGANRVSFKGLHIPFEGSEFQQFSPLVGFKTERIKNIRLHGHFGPKDRGFERVKSKSIDPKIFPQDATAALLERLFPSHVGLLVNSDRGDKVHKWLKPENIINLVKPDSAPYEFNTDIIAFVFA